MPTVQSTHELWVVHAPDLIPKMVDDIAFVHTPAITQNPQGL
jgi:hypothetical protein